MAKERKGLYWTKGYRKDDWLTFEGVGLYGEWWTEDDRREYSWEVLQKSELHITYDDEEFEGTNHQELAVPLEYLT